MNDDNDNNEDDDCDWRWMMVMIMMWIELTLWQTIAVSQPLNYSMLAVGTNDDNDDNRDDDCDEWWVMDIDRSALHSWTLERQGTYFKKKKLPSNIEFKNSCVRPSRLYAIW